MPLTAALDRVYLVLDDLGVEGRIRANCTAGLITRRRVVQMLTKKKARLVGASGRVVRRPVSVDCTEASYPISPQPIK